VEDVKLVKKGENSVRAKKKRKIKEGEEERKSWPPPLSRDNLVRFAFALRRNFLGPKQVLGNTSFQGHRYVFYCLVTFAKLLVGLEVSGLQH
jgi:hypothetical protein